jgi:protein TonB
MNSTKKVTGAATPQSDHRWKKKETNLRNNTAIHFQIGLLVVLLLCLLLIELPSNQRTKTFNYPHATSDVVDWNPIEQIVIAQALPLPTKPVTSITEKIKVVDNNTPDIPVKEKVKIVTPVNVSPTTNQPLDSAPTTTTKPLTSTLSGPSSILNLHEMPVFNGCNINDNNQNRKVCFEQRLNNFIQRHFNTSVADDLQIPSGEIVKISVYFTINTSGDIDQVKVRAPHKQLEREAIRVIQKIPHIIPGKIEGRPVEMFFSLPIKFRVN